MKRFGAGLVLAFALVFMPVQVSGQTLTESEVWQDADREETLRMMTAIAASICAPSRSQVQAVEPWSEAESEFISTVHPLIRANLAGVYGHDIPFWLERVIRVQSMKKHPDVLRVLIEVQTYEGAHNPYGIDMIEFQKMPGPHLFISRVEHRKHPEARPRS